MRIGLSILAIIIIVAVIIVGIIIFAYNKRLEKVVKGQVHDTHSSIPEPKTAISTTYQTILMILIIILLLNQFSMGNRIFELENTLNDTKSTIDGLLYSIEESRKEARSANSIGEIIEWNVEDFNEEKKTARLKLHVKVKTLTDDTEVWVTVQMDSGQEEIKCLKDNGGYFVGEGEVNAFEYIKGASISVKQGDMTEVEDVYDFPETLFWSFFPNICTSGESGVSSGWLSKKRKYTETNIYSTENPELISKVTETLMVDGSEYEKRDITQAVFDQSEVSFEVNEFKDNIKEIIEIEYTNGYKSIESKLVQDFENAGDNYTYQLYDENGNLLYSHQ
ncbi:MAG: hypothetical protein K6E10_03400 [Eubacterium sp.]|nr:hypothetical protein [Eubacterium sp.]